MPGPKGVSPLQLLERARWISDHRARHPTLSYRETIDRTRRHFLIGRTAAEQAYSYLKQLESEAVTEWRDRGLERLTAVYIRIAEAAERKGDLTNARKTADSLRALYGHGAPERVEHSGSIAVNRFADLTDEELAIAAKLDRPSDDDE